MGVTIIPMTKIWLQIKSVQRDQTHLHINLMPVMVLIYYYVTMLMLSVLEKSGLRILKHMSPASTKGPWTMKFIYSQLHL